MNNQCKYYFFNKQTDINSPVFGTTPTHRAKQTHSVTVITVDNAQTEWIEADGIVTRTPNLPVGIITADCVPVLFQAEGVIGAAHAGWQGALNGILENTIDAMQCEPRTITAYVGPCIAQKSYEVSLGFEKPFLGHDCEAERFFMSGRNADKLQFDIAGYCAFRLLNTGIQTIKIDGRDTRTHPDFHSHRGGATSHDRNLSAIMIKG
jgi:YfiH family protein